MDVHHFDRLAAILAAAGSRRRLLRLFTVLPLLGNLAIRAGAAPAAAAGRRKRRKARHKHQSDQRKAGRKRNRQQRGQKRGKKPLCVPASPAETCANQCGAVLDACGGTVECGSCACAPACPVCQICDASTRTCVPDAATAGDACALGGREGICEGGSCILPACGESDPCRVFATSSVHTGDFGGAAEADAICQGLANNAGLPGVYRAWLSDDSASPATRFTRATGPYHLVNGTPIADDWLGLTSAGPAHPVEISEEGMLIGDHNLVWTHTRDDGSAGGNSNVNCQNWTANTVDFLGDAGFSDQVGAQWTGQVAASCNLRLHLYCFQQP